MKLTEVHRNALNDILRWRRDVRHFLPDPINDDVLERLRQAMDFAPSVGNARPWRVLHVRSTAMRAKVIENFEVANAAAGAIYDTETRLAYDRLKLAGLREAPVHLAVFTDNAPAEGHGLGRQSMPEMLSYSTVAAIHTLWLAARAENLGLGWVSILDPQGIAALLEAPESWRLTGYLCLGKAAFEDDTPLLVRKAWQANTTTLWQDV